MRVITAGGMAGWQVALIAAIAAVVAATAAVYLDRALTARRAGLVIAAPASGTADIVDFGRNLTR